MSSEYEDKKGFNFGIIALTCWVAFHTISPLKLLMAFGGAIPILLAELFDIITLIFAILAFVNGREELAIDSENKKAKIGKYIGLIIIAYELIYVFL